MPVEFRKFISRTMVRTERDKLFVFGDNLARQGIGGQAREMRGEPNAVGLPTKRWPTMRDDAFFVDADLPELLSHVDRDLVRIAAHIIQGKVVVWPREGIGTGLSQLAIRAPAIAIFYNQFLKYLHKSAKHNARPHD